MTQANQQALFDDVSTETIRPAAQRTNPWIIVTQVKSNRVVYFTDDAEYQPPMDGDWYYCSTYSNELPYGMTLRNCWAWRFNGGVFNDARVAPKPSAQEALIDSNRKALLRILRDKIDAVREPFLPTCKQGDAVRQIKLNEAMAFLKGGESGSADVEGAAVAPSKGEPTYFQLEAVAVARNISLLEAARLIVAKAEEMQNVLLQTERFREQLTQAIHMATTEMQLLELREWLLDKVYPELTRKFKFHLKNTSPPDLDAPIKDVHRLHEITRLKVQLREEINKRRAPLQSDYIQNDEIRRRKAMLAKALLENRGVKPHGLDFSALDAYAEGLGLGLLAAAQLIANSMISTGELLSRTEAIKDNMLARIGMIRTLRDVDVLNDEIEKVRGSASYLCAEININAR